MAGIGAIAHTTMTDRYEGQTVNVCNEDAQIVEENPNTFTAELEIGEVGQTILLSKDWVESRLGGD